MAPAGPESALSGNPLFYRAGREGYCSGRNGTH